MATVFMNPRYPTADTVATAVGESTEYYVPLSAAAPGVRFPSDESGSNWGPATHIPDTNDVINKPKHYQIFPEYEVRDLCKVMCDRMEKNGYGAFFATDYVQLLQYILRFDEKNGKEDLQKAQYYLKKMVESLE